MEGGRYGRGERKKMYYVQEDFLKFGILDSDFTIYIRKFIKLEFIFNCRVKKKLINIIGLDWKEKKKKLIF